MFSVFFFNDTATPEIYTYLHTLSLHDALPICAFGLRGETQRGVGDEQGVFLFGGDDIRGRGHPRTQLERWIADRQIGGIAHHLPRRTGGRPGGRGRRSLHRQEIGRASCRESICTFV